MSRPPRCGRHPRRKKAPPLGKGGGSVHLEIPSAAEGTLLVEMVVDGGVARFLPVEIVAEAKAPLAAPVAGNHIEIELAGGHRMRISGRYDPEALARLIRGLSV